MRRIFTGVRRGREFDVDAKLVPPLEPRGYLDFEQGGIPLKRVKRQTVQRPCRPPVGTFTDQPYPLVRL